MNYSMLSLTQSPPISVPIRFFLTAPLFGMAAAIIMILNGDQLFISRWNPELLAMVHSITVGFLGMVMIGAMQQLLPVLVGVPVIAPKVSSIGLHLLLTSGVGVLVYAFYFGNALGFQIATLLIGLALLWFITISLNSILLSPSKHDTIISMALSIIGLILTFAIIASLLYALRWHIPLAHPLTDLHMMWGFYGWVLMLMIGVAYQVVPMFQITPEYAPILRKYLGWVLFGELMVWSLQRWLSKGGLGFYSLEVIVSLFIGVTVIYFAWSTIRLQAQRRRRLPDVTLHFWQMAMVSLAFSVLCWGIHYFNQSLPWASFASALFLAGFAISAISGMLYKIIPFLIWLHLNNQIQERGGDTSATPNMKQIIPDSYARKHYYLHQVSLVTLLIAIAGVEGATLVTGVLWLLSFMALLVNIAVALNCYRKTNIAL